MHSGVLIHPRRNGVNTMVTLDAAKYNGTGGELSSCVINTSIRIMYHNIRNKFTS